MDLRERLIDFLKTKSFDIKIEHDLESCDWEFIVDDYLKSINCALDETQAVRQNEDAESNFICYYFENGKISAKCHKPCGDRCCLAV